MQLNKLGSKLLTELFKDSRTPNSQLAKTLHTSKEVINYRIKKLLQQGIIRKFIPLIDFSKLGHTRYRIQIKAQNLSEEDYQFLKTIPQTSWIVKLHGYWNIVVLFWLKDNKEFFQLINHINQHFAERLQDTLFTIVDTIYHFPPRPPKGKVESFFHVTKLQEASHSLNEMERKIITELMKEGRMPILELARKIDSSATNVNYHLKKLIQNKVIIAFIPVINYEKLGLTEFKVTLNLLNPAQKEQLKTLIMSYDNVIYITESYGKYDLEFEMVAKDIKELFAILEDITKKVPLRNQEIMYNAEEMMINELPF